jgi:1,2-phenylacetyl-CoA epoxidase catalytic subunit
MLKKSHACLHALANETKTGKQGTSEHINYSMRCIIRLFGKNRTENAGLACIPVWLCTEPSVSVFVDTETEGYGMM